jgi:hypothetical protein
MHHMKRDYTREEVEHWRDRIHRRMPRLAVRTKDHALKFVNDVGFCFAFKAENSELPCLWHAACGARTPELPRHTHNDPYLSFVWEMKDILPSERRIYYGKLLKRRPTMISLEYLPFFYVLSERTGVADEYLKEFMRGDLTATAKEIMEALHDSSPQVTQGLKIATGRMSKSHRADFDRAIAELQMRMFIVKVGEQHDPFTFVWAPIEQCFRKELRRARTISLETARRKILEKYFQNQLVATVGSITRLFRWPKQAVFQTLGQLMRDGVITTSVSVEGERQQVYCLIDGNSRSSRAS